MYNWDAAPWLVKWTPMRPTPNITAIMCRGEHTVTQTKRSLAGLIAAWIYISSISTGLTLRKQFFVFRKTAQQQLDKILARYTTAIPQPNGTILRIPVFTIVKRKNLNDQYYNWNKEHPYYENWRAMIGRGLHTDPKHSTQGTYASVRVDPAFMGMRNNKAKIQHYDKYGFFAFVRTMNFFLLVQSQATQRHNQHQNVNSIH